MRIPVKYLQEHIIRGDRSDGIPNILTCDDAIVMNKPQKKMSKEKIASLASMDPSEFTNFIRLRNWKRNSELIDFTKILTPVVERIIRYYNGYKSKIVLTFQYFIDNNIQDLIEEFSVNYAKTSKTKAPCDPRPSYLKSSRECPMLKQKTRRLQSCRSISHLR